MRTFHVASVITVSAGVMILFRRYRNRLLQRPGSSYLRTATNAKIADRPFMLDCYLCDVSRPRLPLPPPRCTHSVRMVTWNINILCGLDWSTAVAATDAGKLLAELDADVIVLQEAPVEILDQRWDPQLATPMERVRALDSILANLGYTLLRSPADNATLLATRLPVEATEGFMLDDEPTASVNGAEVWLESRAARFALLRVPHLVGATPLCVYATHLAHKDATLVLPSIGQTVANGPMRHRQEDWSGAASVNGVRRRQVGRLLQHWDSARAARGTAVILADFNQPLASHHDGEEWQVVSAGLASPHVDQPLDDGVATALAQRGFCSAYKLAASNNFGGRPAPPFTHWTGTTVDFAYINGSPSSSTWHVSGAYTVNSPLSDHLPVVVDLVVRA